VVHPWTHAQWAVNELVVKPTYTGAQLLWYKESAEKVYEKSREVIDQKITTKEWTHADLQYHSPAIRDELKRQGYLPDTMKFTDIREYPTTNT
jgi:hypothetical protein